VGSGAQYASSGGPQSYIASTGGAETRPRNIAVMWCIKAWDASINQGNIDITALATLAQQASESNQGTAKIATQAQTDAGTDDKAVVTPKKMRWGFSIGISENLGSSYVVFPTWLGGLIIQWGMTNAIASGANYLQPFPVAFPLFVPAVFTTYPNAAVDAPTGSTYIGQVRAQSRANVTIRNIGPTPAQFYFLAIGR
jgi:hypothetical protein